ncbi:MAG: hypothetical protein M1835_001245 [Candelina submexicana]|nr:MAG: hypothetical protein M1835_001245 [Candelina submexicana]
MPPVSMPPTPNKEDLQATWAYLQLGLDKIMRSLQEGIDMVTYMGVYTAVHNFCTSQKAVSNSSGGIVNNAHRGAHLLGEDLYQNLNGYLAAHLTQISGHAANHTDEALLSYYIREWDRYTTAAKFVNHEFKYLNRHWVKREMDEGKKNVYDVYTLHLVQWKENLFMRVKDSVMGSVLRMVEKQRNGETIEQSQVKSIVDSFVLLGLDEADNTKGTLEVYRQHFEKPFLDATSKYYKNESKHFISENSVVDYMKKAEARLDEEKNRVGLYLHPDIMIPLMKVCQGVLITEHSILLRDEFQLLLDADRRDDLARMYKLLSRITDGLDPLRTKFEAHVRKAGLAAVEKVAAEGDSLDPKVYVDALLEVHTHYQDLVNVAFAGEAEFVRSLDNACREFVNRNKVCKSGSSKSPELLAKYTDTLLKKGTKTAEESDLENLLSQIMIVFKYIEDKDVFQKFYSRQLAKRLVHVTSTSDDAETSMISKLKEACGFEYTNKLQRMFQDMQISKDLNDSYKEWQKSVLDEDDLKKAVDPTYQILGTGFWPLSPATTGFIPPEVLVKTYERFQKFYFDKHSGRKLTWLWHLSRGEVRANYVKGGPKMGYTFQVSTFQIAILVLFNDSDTIVYEDIEKATTLTRDWLDPSLGILVKAKVLLASPDNAKPQPGTTYSLNYNFKQKKQKINLNIVHKAEAKAEVEDTHKTVEGDRINLMQATIVRIMKSRKKLKHNMLVGETIQQIRSRFAPKVPDIKKCIDLLIEKEYLERLEGEELGYLA